MFKRDSTQGATKREVQPPDPGQTPSASAPVPADLPIRQGPHTRLLRGWFLRTAAVATEVGVAFLIRELVAHRHQDFAPFITFYPAVLVACLLDGAVAGIAVTLLATGVSAVWIFPPFGQLRVSDPYDIL